jgi:hypothetical protein
VGFDFDDLRGATSAWPCPECAARQSALSAAHTADRTRGTIGMAAALRHASVERGDPQCLLPDDSEEMEDELAHDERGLFPTGGIERKPHWQ